MNRPYRRAYDHRLRDLVCEERNPALLARLGIPRSTAASWIRRGCRSIVTSDLFGQDEQALRARVLKLERRVQLLLGVVRLLFAVVRLFGFRLDDRSSCPRTVASQLTHQEIATVHELATAMEFRHMPIGVLAVYAQRIGKVFAAPATWGRLIRERGWRRPRQRVYPARPKEGIRSTKPGELLHIDVTIIKLIDGTRTYLHAVIHTFSRRILACELAASLDPGTTCQVLTDAADQLPELDGPATLYADSGVENVNGEVDDLLDLGKLKRVLAQVEVAFSNSMIGSWHTARATSRHAQTASVVR